MANIIRDNPRTFNVNGVAGTGIVIPNGGKAPVKFVHDRVPVIHRVKINLANIRFQNTAAGGGAASGRGLLLGSLPAGKHLILATDYNFTVTTGTGVSVATAVFALGTATAAADASLTSTEANVCASQTLGDGTLAAAATETEDTTVLGTGTAPAIIGGTGETNIYFNIAGTFTHASLTTVETTINGSIELVYVDLMAAS